MAAALWSEKGFSGNRQGRIFLVTGRPEKDQPVSNGVPGQIGSRASPQISRPQAIVRLGAKGLRPEGACSLDISRMLQAGG